MYSQATPFQHKVLLQNVPPSCVGVDISTPCASVGEWWEKPFFYCSYTGTGGTATSGPAHAYSRMAAPGVAVVEMNCSLPEPAELDAAVGLSSSLVSAEHLLKLSVHHYAPKAASDTFSAQATLLPFDGLVGGDSLTVQNAAPPTAPPSHPPPLPPLPPSPAIPPARKSCYQLYAADNTLPDGMYNIEVDGVERQVFCLMSERGGGWTLVARLGDAAYPATPQCSNIANTAGDWAVISDITAAPASGAEDFMSCADINTIRLAGTEAGLGDLDVGYWVTTPGASNIAGGTGTVSASGLYGPEQFGVHGCEFALARTRAELKASTCDKNNHAWSEASVGTWNPGGYWYDASGGTGAYGWFMGQGCEGDHSTGTVCHNSGKCLGYHGGSYSMFHRGWCGSSDWGLVFVR